MPMTVPNRPMNGAVRPSANNAGGKPTPAAARPAATTANTGQTPAGQTRV